MKRTQRYLMTKKGNTVIFLLCLFKDMLQKEEVRRRVIILKC